MQDMEKIKKTVLVTGANGNLGAAVVNYFLQNHWQVIGLVHSEREEKLQKEHYSEYVVDLMDEEATSNLIQQLIAEFGGIEAAVMTAGGFDSGTLGKTNLHDLKKQYQLNFETAFTVANSLLNSMKKNEFGRMFFIGSMPGMNSQKAGNAVAYGLSKSLLFHLSGILNHEMKKIDFKAYVIVPNIIDTPQNRKEMPNADFNSWQKPSEIASIIYSYTEKEKDSNRVALVVEEELK